ncbi:MAG TPA: hypothetical protein VIV54_14265 [Burkholderiales bacterium]
MPRQIALRVFLVVAVLLAQQTAMGHQYWHAASSASLPAEAKKAPNGELLCDLHDLLGTVLGVAGAAAPALALLSFSQPAFLAPAGVAPQPASLRRHSRDPPLVS